jgi:hypothetical protein
MRLFEDSRQRTYTTNSEERSLCHNMQARQSRSPLPVGISLYSSLQAGQCALRAHHILVAPSQIAAGEKPLAASLKKAILQLS